MKQHCKISDLFRNLKLKIKKTTTTKKTTWMNIKNVKSLGKNNFKCEILNLYIFVQISLLEGNALGCLANVLFLNFSSLASPKASYSLVIRETPSIERPNCSGKN